MDPLGMFAQSKWSAPWGPQTVGYFLAIILTNGLAIAYLVCFIIGIAKFTYPLFFWDIIAIVPLAMAAGVFLPIAILYFKNESPSTRMIGNVFCVLLSISGIAFVLVALILMASPTWRCITNNSISNDAAQEICAQAKNWDFVFWWLLVVDLLDGFLILIMSVLSILMDMQRSRMPDLHKMHLPDIHTSFAKKSLQKAGNGAGETTININK